MQQLLLWLSFPFPLFFLSNFFFISQIGVSFTMATPLGFTLAVNDSLYIPSCWWANRSRAQALFVEIPTCVWIETVGLARVMTGVGNVGGRLPRIFSKHPSSREEWVSEHFFCRDVDLVTVGDVPYGMVVLYPDTPLINNLCFDPLFKNVIKINTEVD